MAIMATAVTHAEGDEPGRFGIGYQGVLGQASSQALNAFSLRFAPKPFGGALILGEMLESTDDDDVTAFTMQGKFFYSLIERQNSAFYIGGLLGITRYDGEFSGFSEESTSVLFGGLFGAEWNFSELPEIGFNFEAGYNFEADHFEDDGGADADTLFGGTYVSLGATYYF